MAKNYLAAPFVQDDALLRVFPNRRDVGGICSDRQAFHGACYTLSLSWLSRVVHFRNEEASERVSHIGTDQNIVACVQAQVYVSIPIHAFAAMDEHGAPRVYPGVGYHLNRLMARNYSYRALTIFDLSSYEVKMSRTINSTERGVDQRAVKDCANVVKDSIISPGSHSLIMLYFYYSDGRPGGHAVACSMSNKTLFFFDPNYGEFHIPSEGVHELIKSLLSRFCRRRGCVKVEIRRVSR
jgi:hypothetical protein